MFCLRLIFLPIIFSSIFATLSAHADESPYYHYNQIGFQVSAAREIAHDVMRLTLYSEAQDADPARLAEQTTSAINKATLKARQVQDIAIQTGARHAAAVYDKDGQKIIAWRERAELHLESADFVALSRLSSELLGGLKMAGRSFLLSKSRQNEIENVLTEEAITAFRQRAQLATQALGGKSYKLMNLNLDRSAFAPRLMRDGAQIAMADAVPEVFSQHIEAGTAEVAIIAQGVIEVEM